MQMHVWSENVEKSVNKYLNWKEKGVKKDTISNIKNSSMNREINKKQIKMASSEGKYVTKIELFQELKEIKNDIKEVKKAVIAPNQNKKEIKKEDTKITKLEVQKDKLVAQLSDSRELSIPIA